MLKKLTIIILCLCCFLTNTGCERKPKIPQKITLEETNGQILNAKDLKRKWVVFHYWASWCSPCRHETRELNAFYKKIQNKNVIFLGVNYDKLPLDDLKKMLEENNVDYPNLIQDPAIQLRLGEITQLPSTYIFDPQGRLRAHFSGKNTAAELEKILVDL